MAEEAGKSSTSGTNDSHHDDVTAAIEALLNQLSAKFTSVSTEIFAKMDDMSKRLDSLETALLESKAKDNSKP